MRAPQHSPPEASSNRPSSAILSVAALARVHAAITASVAVGLLAEWMLEGPALREKPWFAVLAGLGIATVALGVWIARRVHLAGRGYGLGFVVMLCMTLIGWAASLPAGRLPHALMLLPVVAGAWVMVTRHRDVLTLHIAIMLASMVAIGALCGVLPGGSAFGGSETAEWLMLITVLALAVFCVFVTRQALQASAQDAAVASSGRSRAEGERDRAEEERDDERRFLQAVIDTSPYAIASIDIRADRVALLNRAFEDLTGHSRDELLGQALDALDMLQPPGGARDLMRDLMREARGAGRLFNVEIPIRTKDGEPRLMRGGASVFELQGNEYYLLVARDVTDEQLMQLERDAIFAASPIGIFTERDAQIRVISAELERWMGWPEGSGAGRPVSDLVGGEGALRELRARSQESLRHGDLASFEWPMFRPDGTPFTARFMGRNIEDGTVAGHHSAVWIVQDVSQEIERQRLLEIARIRAEEGTRVKSRILISTSHQLRTPMNALLNLAELARGSDNDPQQQQHLINHIAASAQSLAALLSDILDFSNLEEGNLLLLIEDYHLGHLVDRIDTTFKPLLQQRGLILKVQMGSGCDSWVSGDARRVRQIITNYINSAISHTSDGTVELTLGLVAGHGTARQLRIEVRCEGPGMTESDAARVFSPFESIGRGAERQFGTALGLAICRDLARLMSGQVGVISQPGKGMTLWVELPLTLAVRTPAAQGHAGSGPQQSLSGLRVLLVEDDELSTVSLTLMLQRWGMHVDSVSDGMQAVRRAIAARDSGRPFDIVLMDLHLPFMHGAEATRWLRREGLDAARLPVVVLTAGTLQSERDEALQAGANDFLSKPVVAEDLRRRILDLLPRSTPTAA